MGGITMIKCAFFPVLPTTVPIVRHLIRNSTEFMITTLLSFPGSGLIGEDGSIADYREHIGLDVQVDLDRNSQCWECLLIADHQDGINIVKNNEYTKQLIVLALSLHKRVVCSKIFTPEECESFKKIAAESHSCFVYLPNKMPVLPVRSAGPLKRLHSFNILFGSIVSDPTIMDTCFGCVEQLSKTHHIAALSTNENPTLCGMQSLYPILHSSLTEIEKVYAINQYLTDIERENHPEIIILHLSEPILPFDEMVPGGFGMVPFIISKSVPTDLFICGIPFALYSPEFAKKLSDGLLGQNGYPVDGISLSNLLIDSTTITNEEHVSVVFVQNELVESHSDSFNLADSIPVYNAIRQDEKNQLTLSIEESYLDYSSTHVIP